MLHRIRVMRTKNTEHGDIGECPLLKQVDEQAIYIGRVRRENVVPYFRTVVHFFGIQHKESDISSVE